MLRTVSAAIVTLLAAAHAGVTPPTCFDAVQPCASGAVPGTEQHVASFGTQQGGCAACTADPTAPGGPGCVSEWDTTSATPVPPLSIPKFRPPASLWHLNEVRLVIRGRSCGIIRVEHKDPLNGCTRVLTHGARFQLDAAGGQGLDALGPVAFFETAQEVVVVHAPFDGVDDFMGPSGHTEIFPEVSDERCVIITNPALLAAFVDDGVGPDTLLFDHSARDAWDLTICGPVTVGGATFAGIELEVSYHYCVSSAPAFCFGSNAACPCGNGSAVDAGCDNAQATGGVRLTASGDPGLDTVVLHGTGFPASTSPTAVVLCSSLTASPVFLGDGLLCLSSAGSPARSGAARASGGTSLHPLDHFGGPGTFSYQLWYRNEPASFCVASAAFNTSSAISIDWP